MPFTSLMAPRNLTHRGGRVAGSVLRPCPAIDVTDATFEAEVIERSAQVPVIVDLWAEWCGPCKTLGPIIEKVIDETGGKVVLAKVDVDANPQLSQALRVQCDPGRVRRRRTARSFQGFVGAQPEAEVAAVRRVAAADRGGGRPRRAARGRRRGLARGRSLELDPGNEQAVVGLAELLVQAGAYGGGAWPCWSGSRRTPRPGGWRPWPAWGPTWRRRRSTTPSRPLTALLDLVKDDDDARQRFLDLLEVLGPDDPRTAEFRKRLTCRLF